MQTTAQDLIERAAKYDPSLAADIRAFAKAREFGLVFEHNRPEAMRLYGKKISKGDTVHILAPRGKAEKPENRVPWRVAKVSGEMAHLERIGGSGANCDVDLSDLVAVAAFEEPIYAGLKEFGRVERGGKRPYQVVINGENYHALEALLFAYAGKVDCIYIDPPYNNGGKSWKYNNDYVDSNDEFRHSKWLAMMERRLRLAKQLLKPEESVLIVTIDENEYLTLGLLLKQVFPGQVIHMVSSVINPAGAGRSREFFRTDEYLYFIQIGESTPAPESRLVENVPVVWDTLRRSSLANARGRHGKGACGPNQFFPIYVNDTTHQIECIGDPLPEGVPRSTAPNIPGCTAVFPVRPDGTEMNWGIKPEEAQARANAGYLRVGKHTPDAPQQYVISYLTGGIIDDINAGIAVVDGYERDGSVIAHYPEGRDKMPTTNWQRAHHDAQRYGTNIVKKLIPGREFPYPKSLYAVEDCLRLFLQDKPEALVLDFFAGSGTTGHAVMRLNHQDGGCRTSIMVTNNEVSLAESRSLVRRKYRQGDPEWERLGICKYATVPRMIAAITGRDVDGHEIKGDYSFEQETYVEDLDSQIVSKRTGKPLKGKRFKVAKVKDPAVRDGFPMADGFEENAIFFDLTYQNPVVVDLDGAYEEVAPLLWMRAGCKGPIIATRGDGTYELAETYAILFDYAFAQDFVMELDARPEIQTVYVVTDDEGRYQSINQALKGRDVVQLYESYLRSFQIAAEGALI